MFNIFNNQASTTNRNIFASQNSQNRPPVNFFTSNQSTQPPTQNNQNTSNLPFGTSGQQNLPANKNLPPNPIVQDSLREKCSFVVIREKLREKRKITQEEFDFVTKKGAVMFRKDPWKENHFKTVKSKEPHLGFGIDEILYRGEVPRCQ